MDILGGEKPSCIKKANTLLKLSLHQFRGRRHSGSKSRKSPRAMTVTEPLTDYLQNSGLSKDHSSNVHEQGFGQSAPDVAVVAKLPSGDLEGCWKHPCNPAQNLALVIRPHIEEYFCTQLRA
eukprot:1159422-Pelagomonas_calceolata.AAC.2